MSRGLGETQFVAELPETVVALAGLTTRPGDMWLLVAGVVAIFVASRAGYSLTDEPWRDCLVLLGLVVGAYSLTAVLKFAFGLPRPPGAGTATLPVWLPEVAAPLYELAVTSDGYGFPSGHAIQSTVAYGAFALTLTVWDRRRRLATAGGVVVLVSLSRVVLGVHYVVDVVVGVLVGVAFLTAVVRTSDDRPGRVLGVAALLGAGALSMSFGTSVALATATAVAGLVAWTYTVRTGRLAASG